MSAFRPHRWCWLARCDLGEQWSSWLVATAEDRFEPDAELARRVGAHTVRRFFILFNEE
jgi:hypothetical protein